MMIMRWCAVQTNEYDVQAETYPNISTHLCLIMAEKHAVKIKVWSISLIQTH